MHTKTPSRTQAVMLALLLIVIVAGMALSGCGLRQPDPTPTPTQTSAPAPTQAPTHTPTPEPEDDVWTRIQSGGALVVGTAADYPPFSYYNEAYKLDGFDVALIREIAKGWGVELQMVDIAFDGLGAALYLGQIDVAIAAISVTPEREQEFAFTNVYYVGEDAILTRADSSLTINSVADMAGLRIGAQRGSVYEEWIEANIVDSGLTAPTNLFAYTDIREAIPGLGEGRVDLVMMDHVPAQAAAKDATVKIAGRGLTFQRYAMALRHGETALQAELNSALVALQNQGRLAALTEEYLKLKSAEVPPPPTPSAPTPIPETTRPAPSCYDGMTLVQHLTYDDQQMSAPPPVPAGQSFVKSWRLQNSGTCTWDGSYSLVYVGGNHYNAHMGGSAVAVQAQVAPGVTYDAHVNLTAPPEPGVYQGFWQMQNPSGAFFGQRIWVGITVPTPAQPTPAPTQTPSPNINFTVDRTKVKKGECVTFSWDVKNVKGVYFYEQGGTWENNGVNGQGSRQVCPTQTTPYYLEVRYQDESRETRTITVYVEGEAGGPKIAHFSVTPNKQIQEGQCVNITWDIKGQVSDARIWRNNTSLWKNAPVAGQIQDCPKGLGDKTYKVKTNGPGGSSSAHHRIVVVP